MRNKIINKIISPFTVLINSLRVRSIQFIISASFMGITIIGMLFVGVTINNKVSNLAEESAFTNTRQVIDQVNQNLDYYLRNMMEISNYLDGIIYFNENISNKNLMHQMNVILNSRKDIVSLVVFSNEGELVAGTPLNKVKSNANIVNQDWFRTPLKEPGNLFFSSPHVQNIFEGQHSWVVSLSRQISFNKDGKKIQGVLLVDMNFSAIDQLCDKVRLGKRGYIYIIDSKGQIVYHPQQQLINVGLKDENIEEVLQRVFGKYIDNFNGETRLITIDTVNYCRWRIVGVAYMDEVAVIKDGINRYSVWIFAFGSIFMILISSFISAKISLPIKKLEKSMKLVEKGQFDINIDIKGEAEVAQLSRTFNLMVSRIKDLMHQIVIEQEAKRRSEINALQAQINPHFLYNTLDSIVWMAEHEKNQDVITMTTALAKLFRISISRGKNVITVKEEIEHVTNYLIIQKKRYKNKFEFEIEAEEEVLKCKTLKLVLQPIVENAIYHGIEYMVDEGLIKICASISSGKLLYVVSDNGLGMNRETLDNLLTYETQMKQGSGVGVKNVHERIQLSYGKEYGLEIESELEVGTTIKIWMPLNKD
jgi:two-component system, sensor histidine kinase YesM